MPLTQFAVEARPPIRHAGVEEKLLIRYEVVVAVVQQAYTVYAWVQRAAAQRG